MKMTFIVASAAVFALSSQAPPQVSRSTTAGVLIDVSVTDNRGQPVMDLQPSDFEISEDGARQNLLSATLVRVASAAHTATAETDRVERQDDRRISDQSTDQPASSVATMFEATPRAIATALVFGSLGPDSRLAAGAAARAYLSTLVPPQDYAGLFVIGSSLSTIEKFTNQPSKVLAAVERLSSTAPPSVRADALKVASSPAAAGLDPKEPVTASADTNMGFMGNAERQRRLEMVDPATGRVLTRDPTILLASLETRLEDGYQRFLSEYDGQTMLAGLRGVIDALARLPGRKCVLLFAESFEVPSRQKTNFETLIGRANYSNITIYTIDAAGLRVHSSDMETAQQVNVAGAQGVGDERRADGAWTKELEQQEKLLSSKPSAALGRLAKDTGGFLIENTNNLGAGFARMQRDRSTYYLLGYQSTNSSLDGSFRRVRVKVKRPKTSVSARPGYVAVNVRD
jgi:VWFA-related protein